MVPSNVDPKALKLAKVTRDKCKLVPSNVYPEVRFRHEHGRLVCVMEKPVDDFKIRRAEVYSGNVRRVVGSLWRVKAHI
jgi:hypothetical protein